MMGCLAIFGTDDVFATRYIRHVLYINVKVVPRVMLILRRNHQGHKRFHLEWNAGGNQQCYDYQQSYTNR